MKYIWMMTAGFMLAACLEPQPAPELPARPSTDFQIETVIDNLPQPWAAEELPDGGFLITGKMGDLWRVKDGVKTPISGLPEDIINIEENGLTAGQGGLLDIALAPDFAQTGTIFLSYSYGDMQANGTALLKADLVGDTLENTQVIFKAGPPKDAASHYGGKILILPDDTLLLTLGEGFNRREDSQKPDTHLGKILRLTFDGKAAGDNPDLGETFLPEIYSLGHRNVQGAAIDPATGDIWTHEHGPRGGDELNRLTPGENYGWPLVTYGLDYNGAKISPNQTDPRFVDPVHVWTPSIAPSGLAIYSGTLFADWQGDALVGGLASGDLRRVDLENGQAMGEEIILFDMKTETDSFRIRDVMTGSDGSVLILIEDKTNGRLLRIKPKN